MKDNEGYITATLNVQDQHFVKYEIDQSVIVGLEERLTDIESNILDIRQTVNELSNIINIYKETLSHELDILKNPKSTWEANSKGGID